MLSARRFRLLFLASALFTTASCGGGGSGGDAAPGSITLSVSPGSLTVQQGSSGTVTITVTRVNFDASVSVSVDGLPSGVTVSTSPAQLTSGITSAVVTVTVSSGAAVGTYTATVHGTATGVGAATATYSLTIVAPPDFSLSAAPAALTISSAATGTSAITIARTGGFAAAVTMTMQSAQAGITGVFSPASVAGNSTSLVVSATSAVPLGTYTVTITGNGSGIGDRTTTLSVTVVAPPDFSLTAAPSALTITAGTTGNSTITIARTGGFTGDVGLAMQSAQAGITGVFAPASVAGNSTSLVVSATSAVPLGTYTVTITGNGSGIGDRTTTLTITVLDVPRIALSLVPTALSVAAGGNGTVTVTITRTNFTGAVTLVASGMPNGLTVTFNTSPTTANSSVATVAVGASVPSSAYPVTITASGTGIANAGASITVTVPATSAVFRYCTANVGFAAAPVWFAYQDGSGAWTRVAPTVSGPLTLFSFNLNSAVGAIATVTGFTPVIRAAMEATDARGPRVNITQRSGPTAGAATRVASPSRSGPFNALSLSLSRAGHAPASLQAAPVAVQYSTVIQYGTRDELIAMGAAGDCQSAGSGRNLPGNVTGAIPSQFVEISVGGAPAFTQGSQAFTVTDVPLGPQTLIAGRQDPPGLGNAFNNRYVIFRDLVQTTGQPLPVVDFNGVNSVTAAQGTLTMQNTQGDQLGLFSFFYFQPGTIALTPTSSTFRALAVQPYYTVPDSWRRPGEFDEIEAMATDVTGFFGDDRSVYAVQTTAAQDYTLAFGGKLSQVNLSLAAMAPYPRARLQMTVPAEYDKTVWLSMQPIDESGTFGNSLQYYFSSAYRAAAALGLFIDVTVPDWSALAQFPVASVVPRGRIYLNSNAETWTGGSVLLFTPGRLHKTASLAQDTGW